MIVVDSCGWLEHFAGTSHGELYDEALRDPRELLVPAVCLAEVFRTMAREAGEPAALDAVGVMSQATVVALDADAAVEAARAGLAHRLPLADSIIYAAARRAGATVWTHDAHFRDLPGVRFVEAPVPG
ncbi:MAG TPA: type II toxin-antitoxin system VapC family toxin [Thermoleophilia bacterium]|nr:type II toxin-antitoxin system VapC family toxin [Thermoleophilia bacterium]